MAQESLQISLKMIAYRSGYVISTRNMIFASILILGFFLEYSDLDFMFNDSYLEDVHVSGAYASVFDDIQIRIQLLTLYAKDFLRQ